MTQPTLDVELQVLLNATANSARILYQTYAMQIKLILLILLVYVSFKIGRFTVTDPVQEEVKTINRAITNRQHYTIYLPQKMKSLTRTRKIVFIVFSVSAVIISSLYYLKHEFLYRRTQQQLQILMISTGIIFMVAISIWIYEKVLAFLLKRGGFNDHLIQQKLTRIINSFGKKTELLLKGNLCRQKYLKRKAPILNTCIKDKCKDHRSLLKRRTDIYNLMVDHLMNFQWCSICKKKVPFDEYLMFQSRQFIKSQDTEQKEVSERNQYLLSQLDRMMQWVNEISPCNCSKRYWLDSTKEIVDFKRQQKIINSELSSFQMISPTK